MSQNPETLGDTLFMALIHVHSWMLCFKVRSPETEKKNILSILSENLSNVTYCPSVFNLCFPTLQTPSACIEKSGREYMER